MPEAIREGTARNSPLTAANYVGICARAMLARGTYTSRHAAERDCLRRWIQRNGWALTPNFCRQFGPVSTGAEHVVYYDIESHRAIKATHPNRFGHSVIGEGVQATPL